MVRDGLDEDENDYLDEENSNDVYTEQSHRSDYGDDAVYLDQDYSQLKKMKSQPATYT